MSGAGYEQDDVSSVGMPGFLQDPIGTVQRRWVWMLPILLIGLAGTAFIVVGMRPTYLATATVLVRSQQIPEAFVRPTVEEDPLRRIDEMVGQVLTRDRVNHLIDKHRLYERLDGATPRSELIERVQGNIEIAPAPGYANVTRGESARIFNVAFEYEDPATAAKVANEIAGLLPTESVRTRTRKARQTTEFLQRELERADAELRVQNAMIREFKESYRGELPGELQANLGKLERLQAQRQSLALQIAESANRVAALAAQPGGTTVLDAGARLEQLRGQLAAELASRTERHPNVVALRGEIANVKAEIAASPSAPPTGANAQLVAAEHVTLRALRAQLRETEAELASLDTRVARTPARQEALAALEEKASVLRESYLEFLRKVQEAELAQNLEATQSGERVSVLSWAAVPTRSERNRWKYLIAGTLASLMGTVGIGVLLEIFDPVLLSAEQMETAGELPVLGSVPRIV